MNPSRFLLGTQETCPEAVCETVARTELHCPTSKDKAAQPGPREGGRQSRGAERPNQTVRLWTEPNRFYFQTCSSSLNSTEAKSLAVCERHGQGLKGDPVRHPHQVTLRRTAPASRTRPAHQEATSPPAGHGSESLPRPPAAAADAQRWLRNWASAHPADWTAPWLLALTPADLRGLNQLRATPSQVKLNILKKRVAPNKQASSQVISTFLLGLQPAVPISCHPSHAGHTAGQLGARPRQQDSDTSASSNLLPVSPRHAVFWPHTARLLPL